MSSSIVVALVPAGIRPSGVNSEPEAGPGQSTLDYARSTAFCPNTEMRPHIPGGLPAGRATL
jgi:hypothetical protein